MVDALEPALTQGPRRTHHASRPVGDGCRRAVDGLATNDVPVGAPQLDERLVDLFDRPTIARR